MYNLHALVLLLHFFLVVSANKDDPMAELKEHIRQLYEAIDKMKPGDLTVETEMDVAQTFHKLPKDEYGDVINRFDNKMRDIHRGEPKVLESMGISVPPTQPRPEAKKSYDFPIRRTGSKDQKRDSQNSKESYLTHIGGHHQKATSASKESAKLNSHSHFGGHHQKAPPAPKEPSKPNSHPHFGGHHQKAPPAPEQPAKPSNPKPTPSVPSVPEQPSLNDKPSQAMSKSQKEETVKPPSPAHQVVEEPPKQDITKKEEKPVPVDTKILKEASAPEGKDFASVMKKFMRQPTEYELKTLRWINFAINPHLYIDDPEFKVPRNI